jgi:hypothetical protein
LTHHYLRLIVNDHSYSGPDLSGWIARSQRVRLSRRLGILWLIVANHDCIYWLYLYGPDPCIPIYFSTTHYTLHESCHFQASVNDWAGVLFMIISHVKIIAFQLSLFCNCRFSKTVLYIINRKIHKNTYCIAI